jgi:hypothetical protein
MSNPELNAAATSEPALAPASWWGRLSTPISSNADTTPM